MQFPTHWFRETFQARNKWGNPVTRFAYGWSNASEADAQRLARERAQRAVEFALKGQPFDNNEYGYGVDPAREELLDTLKVESSPDPVAVVTRNRYGALVLNTDQLLIADVDKPKPVGGFLSRMFGKRPDPAEVMREQLRNWQTSHSQHAVRLYQTAAGFRVIFIEQPHQPTSPQTLTLLESLGSDPLYMTLCKRQQCFRARLSPKPWRCGVENPGIAFPYANEQAQSRQRAWEDKYAKACRGFATCMLLGTFGRPEIHSSLRPVVSLHDQLTLADGQPLA